jgi:putative ABC transport system permease protein
MDDEPKSGMRRLAHAIVAVASLVVPRWRRQTWRREWDAELWYAPPGVMRYAAGAIPHAFALLQQHWSLDMLAQDLRYGWRMLRRNPGFTCVATLTLALGIGATTAIFSIANAVLWRGLPYRDAASLVQLWETNPDRNWIDAECAPANVADWRRENRSFQDLAAYFGAARDAWVTTYALTGIGEPEQLKGLTVTANFFSVLGVQPAFGRTFAADEEWQGKDDVVVISAGLWRRRFGGDPAIVGRPVSLDGRARTVIGVLPADFRFNNAPIDAWIPMGWTQQSVATTRRPHYLRAVARLKPGVSVEQAQADMHRIARSLEERYPSTNTHMDVGVGPLQEWMVGPSRRALHLFLGAVAFVLLVACANVANLMLARGAARTRELAIRSALGASSTRLVRQMLTESVLLAGFGGVLGLLIADAAVRAVVAYGPASIPRLHEIRIDRAALGFTTFVTIATGMVFGLVPARLAARGEGPAWHRGRRGAPMTRRDDRAYRDYVREEQRSQRGCLAGRMQPDLRRGLQGQVREATSSLRGSDRQANGSDGSRFRSGLIVLEVALSLALLVGATLLVRSFVKLNRVDLGFAPDQAVSLQVTLPRSVYPKADQQRAFLDRLLERIRAVPGIRSAGAAQRGILDGMLWTSDFTIERRAPDDFGIEVRHNEVSPHYVEAVGGTIVRGRDFTDADRPAAPLAVLVNEALVRRYFKPGEQPVGQRVNFDRPGGTSPWRTIVGIVRDYREEVVDREPRPTIYEPLAVNTDLRFTVVMRTSIDPPALAPAIRTILRELDPSLPLTAIAPLGDRVNAALAPQRFVVSLMGGFALAALLLATVGLYGVLSYLAARRTHEIGVRVALGASNHDIVRLIARQGFAFVAMGIGCGVGLALMSGRLMSGLLFGVDPYDVASYATVIAIVSIVAACAVFAPIKRALRVNPLSALRAE